MAFLDLNNGFRINGAFPIDSRYVVANEAARFAIPTGALYEGLPVYQEDNEDIYVLTSLPDAANASGWKNITTNNITSASVSGKKSNGFYDLLLVEAGGNEITVEDAFRDGWDIVSGQVVDGTLSFVNSNNEMITVTGNVQGEAGTSFDPDLFLIGEDKVGNTTTLAFVYDGMVLNTATILDGTNGRDGYDVTNVEVPTAGANAGKLVVTTSQPSTFASPQVIVGDKLSNFQLSGNQFTFDIIRGNGTTDSQGPFILASDEVLVNGTVVSDPDFINGNGITLDVTSSEISVQINGNTIPDASIPLSKLDGSVGGVLNGGQGIDIDSNTINVDLAPESGLEIHTNQLRVDVAENGGLERTTTGIDVRYEGSGNLILGAQQAPGALTASDQILIADDSDLDNVRRITIGQIVSLIESGDVGAPVLLEPTESQEIIQPSGTVLDVRGSFDLAANDGDKSLDFSGTSGDFHFEHNGQVYSLFDKSNKRIYYDTTNTSGSFPTTGRAGKEIVIKDDLNTLADEITAVEIERNSAGQTLEQWENAGNPANMFVNDPSNTLTEIALAKDMTLLANDNYSKMIVATENGNDYHFDLLRFQERGGRLILQTDNLVTRLANIDTAIGNAGGQISAAASYTQTNVSYGLDAAGDPTLVFQTINNNAAVGNFIQAAGFPLSVAGSTNVETYTGNLVFTIGTTQYTVSPSSGNTFTWNYDTATDGTGSGSLTFDNATSNPLAPGTAVSGTIVANFGDTLVERIIAGTGTSLTIDEDHNLTITSEGGGDVANELVWPDAYSEDFEVAVGQVWRDGPHRYRRRGGAISVTNSNFVASTPPLLGDVNWQLMNSDDKLDQFPLIPHITGTTEMTNTVNGHTFDAFVLTANYTFDNIEYIPGLYIWEEDTDTWVRVSNSLEPENPIVEYATEQAYVVGDIVDSNGELFRCIEAYTSPNSQAVPQNQPINWQGVTTDLEIIDSLEALERLNSTISGATVRATVQPGELFLVWQDATESNNGIYRVDTTDTTNFMTGTTHTKIASFGGSGGNDTRFSGTPEGIDHNDTGVTVGAVIDYNDPSTDTPYTIILPSANTFAFEVGQGVSATDGGTTYTIVRLQGTSTVTEFFIQGHHAAEFAAGTTLFVSEDGHKQGSIWTLPSQGASAYTQDDDTLNNLLAKEAALSEQVQANSTAIAAFQADLVSIAAYQPQGAYLSGAGDITPSYSTDQVDRSGSKTGTGYANTGAIRVYHNGDFEILTYLLMPEGTNTDGTGTNAPDVDYVSAFEEQFKTEDIIGHALVSGAYSTQGFPHVMNTTLETSYDNGFGTGLKAYFLNGQYQGRVEVRFNGTLTPSQNSDRTFITDHSDRTILYDNYTSYQIYPTNAFWHNVRIADPEQIFLIKEGVYLLHEIADAAVPANVGKVLAVEQDQNRVDTFNFPAGNNLSGDLSFTLSRPPNGTVTFSDVTGATITNTGSLITFDYTGTVAAGIFTATYATTGIEAQGIGISGILSGGFTLMREVPTETGFNEDIYQDDNNHFGDNNAYYLFTSGTSVDVDGTPTTVVADAWYKVTVTLVSSTNEVAGILSIGNLIANFR